MAQVTTYCHIDSSIGQPSTRKYCLIFAGQLCHLYKSSVREKDNCLTKNTPLTYFMLFHGKLKQVTVPVSRIFYIFHEKVNIKD